MRDKLDGEALLTTRGFAQRGISHDSHDSFQGKDSLVSWRCAIGERGRAANETAEFRRLFNGKDLTGWVTPEDKSLFTVENGEIVGRTKGRPQEKRVPGDRQDATAISCSRPRSRSATATRASSFAASANDDGVVSGPQADVADDQWGLLYEERGRGMLQRYPLEKAKKLLKKDGWNEFVITAKGHARDDRLERHANHRPR